MTPPTSPHSLTVKPVTSRVGWEQVRRIRQLVFVEEQGCPPGEEWDDFDWPTDQGRTCVHLLASLRGEQVGTARWREVTLDGAPAAKLERFALLPRYRGRGLGRSLIQATLGEARRAGHTRFVLHAQAYLESLYDSLGFTRHGELFHEAGIPHVKMTLTVPETA